MYFKIVILVRTWTEHCEPKHLVFVQVRAHDPRTQTEPNPEQSTWYANKNIDGNKSYKSLPKVTGTWWSLNVTHSHLWVRYILLISPIPSLNLLSYLFGQILDAHAGRTAEDLFPTTYGPPWCLQGREYYVDTIYLTIGTSLLSFFLSFWAVYRDSRKADKLLVGGEKKKEKSTGLTLSKGRAWPCRP